MKFLLINDNFIIYYYVLFKVKVIYMRKSTDGKKATI